jgi:putative membrane protein
MPAIPGALKADGAVKIAANVLVALVAALHIGFLVLEMFLWTTPFGLETFAMTPELAASSRVLAANQGLYNGFLAAGLIWGLFARENAVSIKVFFLACVIVAGVFGAATAKASILFVQALPAAIALLAVVVAREDRQSSRLAT